MNAIESLREFWKVFDLNKSKNAGMRIIEDGEVTKQHGSVVDASKMAAFVPVVVIGSSNDGDGNLVPGIKRNSKRKVK